MLVSIILCRCRGSLSVLWVAESRIFDNLHLMQCFTWWTLPVACLRIGRFSRYCSIASCSTSIVYVDISVQLDECVYQLITFPMTTVLYILSLINWYDGIKWFAMGYVMFNEQVNRHSIDQMCYCWWCHELWWWKWWQWIVLIHSLTGLTKWSYKELPEENWFDTWISKNKLWNHLRDMERRCHYDSYRWCLHHTFRRKRSSILFLLK